MQPMLTVAELAEPEGRLLLAAVLGTWPVATDDPEIAAEEEEEDDEEGGAACWRRRARCPSLTIWIMASASASSWRTAAWILLVELRLLESATAEQIGDTYTHPTYIGVTTHQTQTRVCNYLSLPFEPRRVCFEEYYSSSDSANQDLEYWLEYSELEFQYCQTVTVWPYSKALN